MGSTICVYASSSNLLEPAFFEAAEELGQRMATAGHTLIYGGGRIGLMGAVARSVQANGGRVIGVIPEKLVGQGYPEADELIVTETMRERKAIMEERADAFISLPGGFGTLEEVLEVLTLKQLGYHGRPLVLLNTAEFYAPLEALFEHMITARFVNPLYRTLYHVADDPATALAYLNGYQPPTLPDKWLTTQA